MNPAVSLEFEHLFRYNNLGNTQFIPPTVAVSSDSITWTNYQINAGVPNNTQSSDPEIVSLNISSVAANQTTVYIKIGWTSRCYYWMIDDMRIVETPPHLLAMQDETFGGWLLSNPTTTGDMGIPYTFNPMKQAVANPYRMEATILNKGGLPQLNTKLNTLITEGGSTPLPFNSTGVTLNILDTITVSTQNTFTPTHYGSHSVKFWASSDSATTDTVGRSTIVTDTIYGRDYDWNTDGTNAGSGYYLGRHACGQILANAFEIYAADTVTSISFHVNDQSVVGAELDVVLYEYDPAQSVNTTALWLEESDSYTLTPSDRGNWVTLKLLNPTLVFAGTAYLAAVKGYQHPTDTSLISSSGDNGVVSFVQDNGCDIGSGGLGYWYSVSKTLMIRMNLGESSTATGISDNYFNGFLEVYPNPSNGKITLEMKEVNNDRYTVTINNLLGQSVYSSEEYIHGFYKKNIDITKFGKGVYLIKVSNSSSIITKKLIIE
jgi:hypothetical protein